MNVDENKIRQELEVIEQQYPESIVITNDEEELKAKELLNKVGIAEKQLEEKRLSVKQPITDAGKAVDNLFRPTGQKLLALKTLLRTEIGRYFTEKENARKEAEAKILARVEKGTLRQDTAATKLANLDDTQRVEAGIVMKSIKKVEYDEALVPKKYKIVTVTFDTALMLSDLLAGVTIPGAKIVEEFRADRVAGRK